MLPVEPVEPVLLPPDNLMTCPTLMRLGFEMPLMLASLPTVVPWREAMLESVSPARTRYVPPELGLVPPVPLLPDVPPEPEIVSFWPTLMRLGFEMPFFEAMALTVVPYFAAIFESVSPDLTVWVLVVPPPLLLAEPAEYESGTVIFCPTLMRFGFEMPLVDASLSTVVRYWLAILLSVSPDFTV